MNLTVRNRRILGWKSGGRILRVGLLLVLLIVRILFALRRGDVGMLDVFLREEL